MRNFKILGEIIMSKQSLIVKLHRILHTYISLVCINVFRDTRVELDIPSLWRFSGTGQVQKSDPHLILRALKYCCSLTPGPSQLYSKEPIEVVKIFLASKRQMFIPTVNSYYIVFLRWYLKCFVDMLIWMHCKYWGKNTESALFVHFSSLCF